MLRTKAHADSVSVHRLVLEYNNFPKVSKFQKIKFGL